MTVSIVKPTVGGDSGVWGEEINAALDVLVAGINNLQGLLGSSYLTSTAVTTLLAGYVSTTQLNARLAGGGATGSRPASPAQFAQFFDTTLHKQITWDGAAWRDGAGNSV